MLIPHVNKLVQGLNQTDLLLNESITEKPPEEQTQWLTNLGSVLTDWYDTENFSSMMQCKILYRVWLDWDRSNNEEGKAIRESAKNPWEGDFYKWAKSYTRSRSEEPSDTTIWNKISVYRDWVGLKTDNFEIPPVIEYQNGFNPQIIDYSKLLIARGAAKRGELDENAWDALENPEVTCERLKRFLPNSSTSKSSNLTFFEEYGILKAHENGKVIEIFEILTENIHDELFIKAASRIFKCAGIRLPDYLVD